MKKLLGLLARGGAGGGDALPAYYVFRDEFDGSQAAAWTDHGANYAEAGGTLTATQSPGTWDEPRVHTAGIARAAGRVFVAWVLVGDRNGNFTVGLAPDADADDTRDVGHSWVMEDGVLSVSTPNGKVVIAGTPGAGFEVHPKEYLYCVVENDVGAVHLLRPFDTGDGSPALGRQMAYPELQADETQVVYVETADTDALLHPAVNYNAGQGGPAIRDLRMVDVAAWATPDALATLADRFDRAASTNNPGPLWTTAFGAAGITADGELYFSTTPGGVVNADAGASDGIWSFTVDHGASATNFFFSFRYIDGNNMIYLTSTFAGAIHLRKVVGGVDSVLANTAQDWSGARRVQVVAIGNQYVVLVNGVSPFGGVVTDAGSSHLSGTGVRLQSNATAGATHVTYDNFSFHPAVVTLPDEILHGLAPQPFAFGAADVSKDFTAANGTALSAYDPNFSLVSGTSATIQSNRAVLVGSGATPGLVRYAYAADDYEVSADFVPAASYDELLAGLVVRCTDADNYTMFRLFRQPGQSTDEIEAFNRENGADGGISKWQVPALWGSPDTIPLAVQVEGTMCRVYVYGQPVFSFPTVHASGDPGIIVYDANDDGTVVDSFVVKAVI